MQGDEAGSAKPPEPAPRSSLEDFLAFLLLFSSGLAIIITPLFVQLAGIAKVPFFIAGSLFLSVSSVTFVVSVVDNAVGSVEWDKNGIITISTLWSLGVLFVLVPVYFGLRGFWTVSFLLAGLLLFIIDFAGPCYELVKRDSKGAVRYWLPGLGYCGTAMGLHIVRTQVIESRILDILLARAFVFCLMGSFASLLAIVPYDFPASGTGGRRVRPSFLSHIRAPRHDSDECAQAFARSEATIVAHRLLVIMLLFSVLMVSIALFRPEVTGGK